MIDYKRYKILFVDDESHALKYFVKAFSRKFNVLTATNASEGFETIEENSDEIGILMTDQRMPGETGVQLLEKVRQAYPQIIRILVTAYADLDSAIAAVNSGAIYKYISKPWDINELHITLMRALDYYSIQMERDQLLKEKMFVMQQILTGSQEKNLAVLGIGIAPFLRNSMQAVHRFTELVPYKLSEDSPNENYWKDIEKRTNSEIHDLAYIASTLEKVVGNNAPFEEPTDLGTILHPIIKHEGKTQPVDQFILNVKSDLPKLRMNPEQILNFVTLLNDDLQAVAENDATITLTLSECTADGQEKMVELLFSDGQPEWSKDQWRQFFSPFVRGPDTVHKCGLNLLICMIVVTHHSGELKVIGKDNEKVIVRLPCDPLASKKGSSLSPKQILGELLKNERHWEYF